MRPIYGSVEPYEKILEGATEIMKCYEYVTDEDYEHWDDCDGRDPAPELYRWAKNIAEQAENYILRNSQYSPINGGEDW